MAENGSQGTSDCSAKAETEESRFRKSRIRTELVDRRKQIRRQNDAHPPVRRQNGSAETDVGT